MLRSISRSIHFVIVAIAIVPASASAVTLTPIERVVKGFLISSGSNYNILPWSVQADSASTVPINWTTDGVDYSTQPNSRRGKLYISATVRRQRSCGSDSTSCRGRLRCMVGTQA